MVKQSTNLTHYPTESTVGQKILKSPDQKIREKKINFIKKFFDQNPFFAISKMGKNQFLNCEKI